MVRVKRLIAPNKKPTTSKSNKPINPQLIPPISISKTHVFVIQFIFSSFVMGKVLNGFSVFDAVEQAADFIGKAIKSSDIKNRNDGIDFEPFLKGI